VSDITFLNGVTWDTCTSRYLVEGPLVGAATAAGAGSEGFCTDTAHKHKLTTYSDRACNPYHGAVIDGLATRAVDIHCVLGGRQPLSAVPATNILERTIPCCGGGLLLLLLSLSMCLLMCHIRFLLLLYL
jgi:hypothetical protein